MHALMSGRPLLAGLGFMAICVAMGQQQAAAQDGLAGHVMGVRDQMPPETLPVPQKLSGIGNVSIKITASLEAQMWFNQGLNLLHDFWEYESARAFEEGVRFDPQCAMCYWGLYKAEGSFHSTAKDYANQALTKAVGLESHVSRAERLYIGASAAHEDALKAAKQGRPDFSTEINLWRKLVKQYPKDTQARIFLSQAVDDQKEYLAILQSVLKDEPENSAANHYWIHALEASPHPEEALRQLLDTWFTCLDTFFTVSAIMHEQRRRSPPQWKQMNATCGNSISSQMMTGIMSTTLCMQ